MATGLVADGIVPSAMAVSAGLLNPMGGPTGAPTGDLLLFPWKGFLVARGGFLLPRPRGLEEVEALPGPWVVVVTVRAAWWV